MVISKRRQDECNQEQAKMKPSSETGFVLVVHCGSRWSDVSKRSISHRKYPEGATDSHIFTHKRTGKLGDGKEKQGYRVGSEEHEGSGEVL